jgi:hypothetical protein
MDDSRSTYESARPNFEEVNLVYGVLVRTLARLVGVTVSRVREKWSSDRSRVDISFKIGEQSHSLTLPYCDR